VVTYILGTILEKTVGFRVSQENEATGLDETSHLETAYEFGTASGVGVGYARPSPAEDEATSTEAAEEGVKA
jgi:Amt family ammonium transporter